MATGVHFGFMQIAKIAQSCHLRNHAESALGPNMSTNQHNKLWETAFLG